MANMSYCRFQNTSYDLNECIDALENRESLSDEERSSAVKMLNKILNFCVDENIIENFDENRVSNLLKECSDK